ncbi:odorant receptor 94a [Bactrocera oleae]|uniref:odorant receptor 94a n=1 Tax=Bactrocera oleae TaxID=104688 RepID=UPI00387E8BD4
MAFDKMANFHTLKRLLIALGLWHEGNGSRFERHYRYYQLFVHTTITFTFTLLLVLEVMYSESLNHAIDVLKFMLCEVAVVFKVLNAWYYARKISELVNEWESSEIFALRTSAEEQMWQKTQINFHKLTMIYICTGFNSAICALLSVLLMGAYELPYALWTPYDWSDTYFWPMYCYEFIAMPFTCLCNITIDLFQAYLLLHLTLCFRVISMRLESAGTENAITNEFLNNIKMHQRVKEMAFSCEQVISLSMLTQIMLTFLIICFIIYNLQSVHFSENPVHFLAMFQFALVVSLQMFLPCYYGNELTIESEKLGIHLYSCDWTAMSAVNRRLIFFYMESLKKPLVLCAGKFFEIGIPIFSKAMNNTYSVLTLLMNVNDDQQR